MEQQSRNTPSESRQVCYETLEPGSDGYLGWLCWFNACPKGKPECLVRGCGASPFLRQHEDFALAADALRPERIVVFHDAKAPVRSYRP